MNALLVRGRKFEHAVARRDRVRPLHCDVLVEFVFRAWSEVGETGKDERHAFGLQHRAAVGDLQMEVGAGRVAAVTEQCEDVTGVDLLLWAHFDTAVL